MAQISFNELNTAVPSFSASKNDKPSVGFFSLKNDGDEAVVRIMHDSTADFDILTTHPVTVDGKHRRVSCVREANDALDKCPLCASGAKVEQRIYIHLLQYTKASDGTIVVEPKVWERDISYANKLKVLIENYGPLSNSIFKIKRCGVAGYQKTTYEINYAVPSVFPENLYPKKEELLDGYTALGRAVLNKNANDIVTFLTTGSFPKKAPTASGQTFTPQAAQATPTPTYNAPSADRTVPWGKPVGEEAPVQAPVRYYE